MGKEDDQRANPLKNLNNEIPAPFRFYQADMRRPREINKQLLDNAFNFSRKGQNKNSLQGSMDPRDRLLNANNRIKEGLERL